MFFPNERTAIFIDGRNTFSAARSISLHIDFAALRTEIMKVCKLITINYYVFTQPNGEFDRSRGVYDWLEYNGFTVIQKEYRDYTDASGQTRIRGSFAVDITLDIVELSNRIEHIVLFSGDGDLSPVVQSMKRKGIRFTVVSTLKTNNPSISDNLRRVADNFMDLDDMRDLIEKKSEPA
tara:strand:- start:2249 stop:2785 length:537 start_codon:yes stop_codon:yes gene_type:complete